MVAKTLVLVLIIALILPGTFMQADAVAPPRISSPADGSVLLVNTVDVTGTSEPTNASWAQTTQADFDGGETDNVTVTAGGDIRLAEGGSSTLYDDFDDGSLDSRRWTTKSIGTDMTLAETGGCLKFSGIATGSGYWQNEWNVISNQRVSFNVSAVLSYCSLSGSGASTLISLYQDGNNFVNFGPDKDIGLYGNNIKIIYNYCIAGSFGQVMIEDYDNIPHRFTIELSPGTVFFLKDGALVASRTITLANPDARLRSGLRMNGDSVDARWDNFTIDPVLRMYDDFNDNTIDANRWDTATRNGITTTEENGKLRQSGTGTGSGYWNSYCEATSKSKFASIVSAELSSFSGSGSAYSTRLLLYQDGNNHLWIGLNYDPPPYGNQIIGWWGFGIGGSFTEYSLGATSSGPHTFMIIYGVGTASVYMDGQLKAQKVVDYQNTVCAIWSRTRSSGDTVDARWDDIRTERNRTVYDDFNDNSFDSTRWTKLAETYGLSASEASNSLQFSGTCTAGTWVSYCDLISVDSSSIFFADLKSVSVSANGFGTQVGLYQDANNYFNFGPGTSTGYSGICIVANIVKAGVFTFINYGISGTWPHRLGAISTGNCVKLYVDGVLFKTIQISLNNPKCMVHAGLMMSGDSASALWDNAMTGWDFGTLLPSGNFTSAINDTRCPAPSLKKISWTADVPSGSAMTVLLRSSDNPDMSDPTSWTPVTNNQTAGLPAAKRYIQYKAAMSRTLGDATPVLRDIVINYQRPVSKVELSIDNQATWITAAGTSAWRAQLALPEGKTTVWVRATDGAGDAALSSVTVTVDTMPPGGAVLINNGDEFAGDPNVTLGLNATDQSSVSSVMLGEDPELIDASWTSYRKSMPFQLSPGDGPKTVYARFRDVNGWESEIVSDSIVLDTQAPVGSVVINGGAEFTAYPNVTLTFTASDLSGVGQMLVGNLADLSGAQWIPFAPLLNWTVLPGNGERTVYLKLRDMAGHETVVLQDSILLDTIAPALTLTIDSGAAYTRHRNATITLTGNDNYRLDAMLLSQSSGFPGSSWEPFQTSSAINLAEGDGLKTVFGKARDAAGNEGPVVSDSIIMDTNPPAAAILNIPREVDTPNFTVSWSGTDVISGIASYDVQYRDGSGAWTDWLQNANGTSATFKGVSDHNYSFRARARDNAGNVGSYPDSADNSVYVWPKHIPVVTVTAPKAGSLATGTLRIFGTAFQPDHRRIVARVEVRIDDGEWQMAEGTSAWSFRLDTKKLGDGPHTLTARAFDGERYSNETGLIFKVNNLESSTTLEGLPLLLLVLIVVAVAVAGAYFAARRRRLSPAGERPLPPEAVPPPPARPPPVPPAAPPPAPPARIAVVGKVDVEDLDDEEAPPPAGPATPPPPEPVPVEPPAPRLRDETAMREGKILKSLSSLPRGLPSSLWGLDMEDLAAKVVSGERRDSPDGDLLVKIGNRWYYGDETNLGSFMQEYKK